MKTAMKKILSLVLTAALITGLMPAMTLPALAADNISYIDASGQKQTASAETITAISATTLNGGWYYIDGTLTTNGTVTISGDVKIILVDGCDWTVNGSTNNAGINVSSSHSLTIYGQTNGTGKLTAQGGDYGAGIGGGYLASGGNITISGGTVTAIGGPYGAGIGGGYALNTANGNGGNITISGGIVEATGGDYGAGIGGGRTESIGGNGGNILIYGTADVTAKKGAYGNNQEDIGKGSAGSSSGNIFAALPTGKLKNASGNIGNTVAFSSDSYSSQPVTAALPAPWSSTVTIIGGLAAQTDLSVYTTLTTETITLSHGSYPNADKTGTELMTGGAAVAFSTAPPSIIVANTADSGVGSLRQAMANAVAGDTITFDATAFATKKTITLASALTIDKNFTIEGPAAGVELKVSGDFRHFSSTLTSFTLTLKNLTLTGRKSNPTDSTSGGGVRMYGVSSALFMENCTVQNCYSSGTDGGVSVDGTVTLAGCTIANNTSGGNGGGVCTQNNAITLTNCTVIGNSAGGSYGGGGVYAGTATATITSCTIIGNSLTNGTANGGGVYAGTTAIYGCIIAGNTSVLGGNSHNVNSNWADAAPTAGNNYNIIGTPSGYSLTELFGMAAPALADNGGLTQTILIAANSPAHDIITANPGWTIPSTDQRGSTRPFGSGKADIGAVELQSAAPATLVTSITVTGAASATTITTNGGILQMSAAVLPANATNSAVTWSVENGTGSASISASGLLTAAGNGTVTVKATADDGSGVVGSLLVTISGQSGGGGSGGGGSTTPAQPNHGYKNENNTYTHGSGRNLVHTTEKGFSYFSGVKVDGKTLTRNTHYGAESGSTIITLYADYLDTLSVGKHTLEVSFTDGVTVTEKFTVAASEPWVNPYADVIEGAWYYGDVEYVCTNRLMDGISNNLFAPNMPITRGMIVTILYRLEGSPDVSGLDNPFSDVEAEKYYAGAVKRASDNGIVEGYDGKFSPEANITRQNLAVILWRYAKFAGINVSVGEDTNILSYNDAFDVAEYAIPAMQWAAGAGIITGKPGGLLDPNGTATRAEAAAMLHRFLGG